MQKTQLLFLLAFIAQLYSQVPVQANPQSDKGKNVRLYDPLKMDKLKAKLKKFPNLQLADLPTPMIHLANLSQHLGGPQIYLKSDNLTGHGGGGNKLRKLSYVMADALEKGATDIITTGATQSNHSRMTASQCARLSLKCHLVLENRRANYEPKHINSGNVFLDKLFGASVYHFKKGTDTKKEMELLAEELKKQGKVPYIIPGGASNELGAAAYAEAAMEILEQLNSMQVNARIIVSATGSAGTQSGLATGLQALASEVSLLGISTKDQKLAQEEKVFELAKKAADRIGIPQNEINRN
ncbi:MAG: pyridoxal-phosphate dependent enzyme [Oligoflexales bacterium]|nr:pyridoxal-phosphate dependent enzyme [Oligoflexales bacterium]